MNDLSVIRMKCPQCHAALRASVLRSWGRKLPCPAANCGHLVRVGYELAAIPSTGPLDDHLTNVHESDRSISIDQAKQACRAISAVGAGSSTNDKLAVLKAIHRQTSIVAPWHEDTQCARITVALLEAVERCQILGAAAIVVDVWNTACGCQKRTDVEVAAEQAVSALGQAGIDALSEHVRPASLGRDRPDAWEYRVLSLLEKRATPRQLLDWVECIAGYISSQSFLEAVKRRCLNEPEAFAQEVCDLYLNGKRLGTERALGPDLSQWCWDILTQIDSKHLSHIFEQLADPKTDHSSAIKLIGFMCHRGHPKARDLIRPWIGILNTEDILPAIAEFGSAEAVPILLDRLVQPDFRRGKEWFSALLAIVGRSVAHLDAPLLIRMAALPETLDYNWEDRYWAESPTRGEKYESIDCGYELDARPLRNAAIQELETRRLTSQGVVG